MIKNILKEWKGLPNHCGVLGKILTFFQPQATGAFISGSGAANNMDTFSDLDLGFLFDSQEKMETVWQQRWHWNIAPWFHRFDADHVKNFFVIYLFEPNVKADICFYTKDNLPGVGGAPYKIIWDKSKSLRLWLDEISNIQIQAPSLESIVHDDERFWAWCFYTLQHIARGEHYEVARTNHELSAIPEGWHAILQGRSFFNHRRVEERESPSFLAEFAKTFPLPEKASNKSVLLELMRIQDGLFQRMDEKFKPCWKTTETARSKIRKLAREL